LYREAVDTVFRYYTPGYRDWVNYRNRLDFEKGLVAYLGSPNSGFLERNGISVATVLNSIMESTKNKGVIETYER